MPEGSRKQPSYFMYFPEDYRWSAAVINVLGAGSYGAADIGEVDRIGRMLRGKEGDDAAWFDAWCEVAGRVRGGRGLLGWIPALPWEEPMVLAVGLSLVMGTLGGLYPAWRPRLWHRQRLCVR